MSFQWPAMLVLLILVPLLVAFYLRLQKKRRQLIDRYANYGFIHEAAYRSFGARRHLPPALFLAGLAVLVLAMARPQAMVSLPRVEGTVILAFDVSGSMSADDFQPNRMEAAKIAASDFVDHMPSTVQIGIVAFSDGGFAIQPPTHDPEVVLATIERLGTQRGTSLGQGIMAALNTIAPGLGNPPQDPGALPNTGDPPAHEGTLAEDEAVIVLLSDGENNMAPDPLLAAQLASNHKIRIYTVGIGSPAGATLSLDGFLVHTQLNEALLQSIAAITGGEYFNAQNEIELQQIYANLAPELVIKPEQMEVTSLFAGASVLILLIGGVFSFLWFSRIP